MCLFENSFVTICYTVVCKGNLSDTDNGNKNCDCQIREFNR